MSSTIGQTLKITVFGQSHSPAIGAVIEGFPAGFEPDFDALAAFMARRAPGGALATARKEADEVRFLSGLADGKTCGAPLSLMIENTDTRSKDYAALADIPRPSHADYPAAVKYGAHNDVRGGGHFSGRLTAPLCAAGALCMQLLERFGVTVGAHIYSIHGVCDEPFDLAGVSAQTLRRLAASSFPVLSEQAGDAMRKEIAEAAARGDSVGGIIECAATGLPAGLGDPIFDGLENRIAAAVFGVPAVKGIEFGAGFAGSNLSGSQNNDPWYYDEAGQVRTRTNHSGGILGGLSTGMPLVLRAAIKPTPSVFVPQESIRLSEKRAAELRITGRHDPCVAARALPGIVSAVAVTLTDMMISEGYIPRVLDR